MITGKGETAITSEGVASRSRGQSLKVVKKTVRSTDHKGRHLSDRDDRIQSRSKSRTLSQKRHLNANSEVANRISRRLDSLPIQKPVLDQGKCSNIQPTKTEDD